MYSKRVGKTVTVNGIKNKLAMILQLPKATLAMGVVGIMAVVVAVVMILNPFHNDVSELANEVDIGDSPQEWCDTMWDAMVAEAETSGYAFELESEVMEKSIQSEFELDKKVAKTRRQLFQDQFKMVYGYVDITGAGAVKPRFSQADSFVNGYAKVKMTGKGLGFINPVGLMVIGPVRGEAKDFSGGVAAVQRSFDGRIAEWGFIDRTGKWIFEHTYSGVGSFVDGVHLARAQQDGKWGYINIDGSWVIEPDYSVARDFIEGANVAIVKKSGRWMLINAEGKKVSRAVKKEENLPLSKYPGMILNKDPNGYIPIKYQGKVGYADETGRVVVKPQFDYGEPYSNGRALVGVKCPKKESTD